MIELTDDDKLPPSWRQSEAKDVLAEAVRRLRLPYSRRFVRQRYRAVGEASAPKACLAVGTGLGLEVSVGKLDPAELRSPAPGFALMVELTQRGFALVEEVAPEGVRLWDAVLGSWTLSVEEFARAFSGLVLMLERPDGYRPPVREEGRYRTRLLERFFEETKLRTDFAGPKASRLMGPAALGLVVVHVAVGAARSGAVLEAALLGPLFLVGLLLSYAMLRSTYGGSQSVNILCGGKQSGCNNLLHSRFSKMAGVPASGLGLAFFTAQLVVLGAFPAGGWIAGCLSLASVPEALFFFWVMRQARAFCRLCAVVHGINFTVAAYFIWRLLPQPPGLLELAGPAVAWLLLFILLLAGVVPLLVGVDRSGLIEREHEKMRESPWWLARQLEAAPAVTMNPLELTVEVTPGAGSQPLLIWVLALLDCPACAAVMKGLEDWASREGGQALQIRVGFLAALRPGLSEALVSVGLATGGRRLFDAYRWVKADEARLTAKSDAFSEVSQALGLPLAELEAQRERASRMVKQARRDCDAAGRSGFCETPYVVFAGRRVEGSLRVIEELITQRPDLLRAALQGTGWQLP